MDKINNLLQQVSIIQKKYDDLAEYSGEHYNVFDILGIRSDELSHSSILTNLLDAKGKHGQKDIFLKLFIEQIHPLLEKSRYYEHINSFDTEKATAKKEIHIGGVKHETAEGGRVDIVVSSGNKHLVIENKIYAGDQDQQLLRYDNHYKNDPIIYLTLYGDEPSKASKGNLVLGTDFICISYHTDISNWLEKCIKEMTNKPIIRETLNQYLFLIKSLTNQSNNNKMSEEIIKIINSNRETLNASKLICDTYDKAKNILILDEVSKLVRILFDYGFKKENISIERSGRIDGFFLILKTFDLGENGYYDLGINVELNNDFYFFCVIKKDENRNDRINTESKFMEIKEYLQDKIKGGLISNGFSIGYLKNWKIGLNQSEYYFPDTNNDYIYNELAKTFINYKNLLNQ